MAEQGASRAPVDVPELEFQRGTVSRVLRMGNVFQGVHIKQMLGCGVDVPVTPDDFNRCRKIEKFQLCSHCVNTWSEIGHWLFPQPLKIVSVLELCLIYLQNSVPTDKWTQRKNQK